MNIPKKSHSRDLILQDYIFCNPHDDQQVFDMLSQHYANIFVSAKKISDTKCQWNETFFKKNVPSNVYIMDPLDTQFDHPDCEDTFILPKDLNDDNFQNLQENVLWSCGRQGILMTSGSQLNQVSSQHIFQELSKTDGLYRSVIFSQKNFPQLCQNWYHKNVQYISWNPTWFLSQSVTNDLQ